MEQNIIITNYEYLTIAIIQQAAKDYRSALKRKNKKQVAALEKWLMGDWAQLLSNDMGEIIIKKCQEQVGESKRMLVLSMI
jgi:hypothetical protein